MAAWGRLDGSFAPRGVHRGNFGAGTDVASALAPAGDTLVAAGAIGSGLRVARYLVP